MLVNQNFLIVFPKSLGKEVFVYQPDEIMEIPFDSLEDCKKCLEEEIVFTTISGGNNE